MGQKQGESSSSSNLITNANSRASSRRTKAVDCLKCPHCAGPLSKEMETSQWTVPPLIRDSFSMIGSAVGGTASAFYGFNYVMPIVQRRIKGPMLLHFLVGAPPVIVFSSACAGLAGDNVIKGLNQDATCPIPLLNLHLST
ncbi:uncharacterized protein LOC113779081 isoform X2 [Coffea eugenioides]|uniref:uncharacterized protein LOC113779081 isoform X2 n=1 Tax=Coffea eugenioides TaxID=49369 RepID=UPI000F5C5A65|nr:uncharacterized protein LOC113707141 isoform X2 [Coffea arabica]XP_027180322.1 uncharacterized protein LOC113779081 isoform X2 [Coffea eugenioides]